MIPIRGIILDVDGTFIDSNDAHAKSWAEAMAAYAYNVVFEKVRPLIGMGGDKVLPQTIHLQKDSEIGSQMSKRREAIFKERYLPRLRAFPGAQELLQEMRKRGLKLAIASSAQPDERKSLLRLMGAEVLVEEKTSSKDVSRSKPDPDRMQVTLMRTGLDAHEALMIGDTAYDIEAARTAPSPFAVVAGKMPTLRARLPFMMDPPIYEHITTNRLSQAKPGKEQRYEERVCNSASMYWNRISSRLHRNDPHDALHAAYAAVASQMAEVRLTT